MQNSIDNYSKLEKPIFKNILRVVGVLVVVISLAFLITDAVTKLPSETQHPFSGKYINFKYFLKGFSAITYFTDQSNLILGVAIALLGFYGNKRWSRNFFFSALVWISITFVIYWVLISWNTNAWFKPYNAIQSLVLHAINPFIAFAIIIYFKNEFSVSQSLFFKLSLYVFGYFLALWILYMATLNSYSSQDGKRTIFDGAVVYNFINFLFPFFYRGQNTAIVVILDILIFAIAFAIPVSISLFWAKVLKLKFEKNQWFKWLQIK
ncbi:MAGa3780 family membrane protein [Mesomycoplasma bovoculi]|uniref:Transmembrane protein n=1 Tax=Mesomycoplasma bovoculi M165/69 TaxID=743966 RepID=W5V163_9BACT|nr:hypothetical protein [Mesomycoplasma bovoculi]AHH45478.1 hypothetical protein MYB_02370 [Mesomycoplasma bovoculi M165/69]